ncbi:MAG: DUF1800 domain-containing protein [Planctomycetota bacterium]
MLQQSVGATAPKVDRPAALRDPILALVHRATFGYTTEEHARARSMGFEGWRDEQLAPDAINDSALDAELASFGSLPLTFAQMLSAYPPSSNGDAVVATELRSARILRAVLSRRQLFERVVEFWTDHFNIDGIGSAQLRYLKSVDDREVIRTHALGRFRDLLGASAKSGAMLVYLDNASNVAGAPNENYARELMELHTLGSDGGYSETDVVEVARCLTGWTIRAVGSGAAGTFRFDANTHDDLSKIVLGVPIPPGGGQQDGETVLDLLASHPNTAARIARKMCVFFLDYEPAQTTVDRVAARFLETDGDLRETLREVLSRASFEEIDVWSAKKLRRPMHMALGAVRSTGASVAAAVGLAGELQLMGHAPFTWAAPNGFPDALGAWGTNLLPRWSFASRLTAGGVPGALLPLSSLSQLFAGVPANRRAAQLDRALTGGRMAPADVTELQAFLDAQPTVDVNVAREAVALALSLPSTQWL